MNNISFQTISNDSELNVRKLGDPSGYCLAWTFWYLEMRINNPNIHPKQLVKKAVHSINKENNKKRAKGKYVFIDFIRNYANKLDKLKNDFILQSGIEEYFLYNMVLKAEDQEKLMKNMVNAFNKIIQERI